MARNELYAREADNAIQGIDEYERALCFMASSELGQSLSVPGDALEKPEPTMDYRVCGT